MTNKLASGEDGLISLPPRMARSCFGFRFRPVRCHRSPNGLLEAGLRWMLWYMAWYMGWYGMWFDDFWIQYKYIFHHIYLHLPRYAFFAFSGTSASLALEATLPDQRQNWYFSIPAQFLRNLPNISKLSCSCMPLEYNRIPLVRQCET